MFAFESAYQIKGNLTANIPREAKSDNGHVVPDTGTSLIWGAPTRLQKVHAFETNGLSDDQGFVKEDKINDEREKQLQ